jgi:hypothetical protein
MNRELSKILADIDAYAPGTDWLGLDALLEELFTSYEPPEIPAAPLLRLFERFPEHDGFGVFWAALHGIEDIPNYEQDLVESLERRRSQFGLVMAQRILNSQDPEAQRWHEVLRRSLDSTRDEMR